MNTKLLLLPMAIGVSTQLSAFQLDTGDDWSVRWDNTLKYNLMARTAKQDSDVYAPPGLGGNFFSDPDFSFDRQGLGIVSNRLDILSELDVIWKDNMGFRISAAGWYDHAYSNDMDQEGVIPQANWSTGLTNSPGELTDAEEDLHYRGGEILDAFVFWNWDIGEVAGNLRAGRHTIYWGQSLLSTGAINSAGGAMNPLDFSKALSVPGSEAKELFMPTNKISTLIQLTDNFTLSAFYSLEYEKTRLPTGNTYFSPAAGFTDDVDLVHVADGVAFKMRNDEEPDDGEWGVNFSYYFEEQGLEVSAYYLNYHDKFQNGLTGALNPLGGAVVAGLQLPPAAADFADTLAAVNGLPCMFGGGYFLLPGAPCAGGPTGGAPYVTLDSTGNVVQLVGDVKWTYKEDNDLYGLSFAKEIGGVSYGMDISYRKDVPLRPNLTSILFRSAEVLSGGTPYTLGQFQAADESNYVHATGDTWHVVINALGLLRDNGWWEGGSYIVEATFSMLDEVTSADRYVSQRTFDGATGKTTSDVNVEEGRITSHIAVVFKPTWYQVRPGVDMNALLSAGVGIDGNGTSTFMGDEESGSGSVGLEFSVDQTWTSSIKYNFFFGPTPNSFANLLKDRDNISMTFKRTF